MFHLGLAQELNSPQVQCILTRIHSIAGIRLEGNPGPWMSMVFGTKLFQIGAWKRNPGQSQGPLAIVLPLFLLRGALMNARGLRIGNTFSELSISETTNRQSL